MTKIQKKAIPILLEHKNVIVKSETGSGKTLAYIIPLYQNLFEINELEKINRKNGIYSIIFSPTHELCLQIEKTFDKLKSCCINVIYGSLMGGQKIETEKKKLRKGLNVIITTPGRLLYHLQNTENINFRTLKMIIIDEADKMMELSMGDQIRKIIQNCPPQKQMILLSATIQEQLATFLKSGIIKEYKILSINEENKIPEKLKIHLIYTRREDKLYTLISLLKTPSIIDIEKQLTIIFVMTKYHCDYLQEILKYWEISSLVIYGSMEQDLRNQTLEDFKKGRKKILIVTDVAARGIDIPLLDNVINFDFPDNHKLFIHRVGRTARAGKSGRVFNLINSEELPYFFDIKYYLGKKFVLSSDDEETKKNKIKSRKRNSVFNRDNSIFKETYGIISKSERMYLNDPSAHDTFFTSIPIESNTIKKYGGSKRTSITSLLEIIPQLKPKRNYFNIVHLKELKHQIQNFETSKNFDPNEKKIKEYLSTPERFSSKKNVCFCVFLSSVTRRLSVAAYEGLVGAEYGGMRERAHQVPLPILHAEFVNLYPGKDLQGRVQVHRFGKHRGAHGAVRD